MEVPVVPDVPAVDVSMPMDLGAPADVSTPIDRGSPADVPTINECVLRFPLADVGPLPRTVLDPWQDARGRLDTTNDARCLAGSSQTCVVVVTSFQIVAGQTLQVTGTKPLIVVSIGDLVIQGTLDARGEDGTSTAVGGPGAHPQLASLIDTRYISADPACGAGQATAGGRSACPGRTGNGGTNYPLALSGGYVGGTGAYNGANRPVTFGGMGGGAVRLVSLCGSITITGSIDASGGGGDSAGAAAFGGGAGGGSGGTVWLHATSIQFDARSSINLSGGGGGGGTSTTDAGISVAGQPARRDRPGEGNACGATRGGTGGAGGRYPQPPGDGTGTTVSDCGAGGGSYGRLVLQTTGNLCAQAHTTGECLARPL
jgi:hypothetical protein